MPSLYPVILAGGSGTRLWPLSRKNYPKQFLNLQGEWSLLQQTVLRARDLASKDLLIVSNDAHYFLCQEQLEALGCQAQYLLEPCARNTAPAIAAAAHYLLQQDENAIMLVLPSDHWLDQEPRWQAAMRQAADYVQASPSLVTFGIQPAHPNTGYGYIEVAKPDCHDIQEVISFREKPDLKTATDFVAKGHYFWNSGMFLCPAKLFLHEIQSHAPEIWHYARLAVREGHAHNDFLRLDNQAFSQCPQESIDYAVLEKSNATVMLPLDLPWSDLGDWNAVADAQQQDESGNSLQGNVLVKNSENCLISSEHTLVTALGLQNQIVIATRDAVLVADKRYSQQVKDLVSSLQQDNARLADDHQRVSRPWGYYEVLAEGKAFKVKRLMVKPGAALSLQRHQRRAEHWVVVGGQALVINGAEELLLSSNQSTYIPEKTKHRLSNPGTEPLYVIEVQTGDYLGEDDIERFEDVYAREIFA